MRTHKTATTRVAHVTLIALFWMCPSSGAQDQLEQVQRQVRQELGEADTMGAAEVSRPPFDAGRPGYFGIIADDRQLAGAGVRIVHVAAESPALRAGLQVGDLITAVDGRPLRHMRDLAQVMTGSAAGMRLRVTVQRGDQSREVLVTLDRRPPQHERLVPEFGRIPESVVGDGTGPTASMRLGLTVGPLTEAARRQHNLPVVAGVLVTGVAAGSTAQQAGLSPGSVIVAVSGQPIATPDSFDQLVAIAAPQGDVDLTFYGHGKLSEARLRFAAVPGPADERQAAPLPAPEPYADLLDRIDQLQRRVEQLQRRVQQLEQGAK